MVQMLEDGSTQRDVAAAFGVTQSVVSRACNRYLATGGYIRSPGQGRLRCTTAPQDHYIRQMVVRRSTAQALQMDFLQVSRQRITDQTVRNRLHENGLHSRPVVPFSPGNTVELELTLPRIINIGSWRPILFTDESRFHVSTCDRRERYADSNIGEYDRYASGSVMV